MKRYMAILGFVFVGVLAGLLVRGIPIVLHVNAGGEIPRGSQNGDVNGDSMLDMSDAVYLLIHLFNGGPEPIACADSDEIWDEVRAIEGEVNGLGGPLASIAESLAYESCKNRHDRFVEHGNGTVTDRLTRLMWTQDGRNDMLWEEALSATEETRGGHEDWRLPTAMELQSIFTMGKEAYGSPTGRLLIYPVFRASDTLWYWSSSRVGDETWCIRFGYDFKYHYRDFRGQTSYNLTGGRNGEHLARPPVPREQLELQRIGTQNAAFFVRDIAPAE